ncbi:2-phospho-L-lactate guanylyltransferase [Calidifontibacter terrae]
MSEPLTSTWQIVLPVKNTARGKSRLTPPPGIRRADLALAIALDTIEVVLEVIPAAQVVVVTDDDVVRSNSEAQGVTVLDDPGRGLNPAIESGLRWIRSAAPGRATAVLLADLPSLTAQALYDGLRACAATESSIVPDQSGHGTVLLTHHDSERLVPRFGGSSAARHGRTATVLTLDLPQLRTDVDDLDALNRARDLGVGPRTAGVLATVADTAS